MTVLLIKQLRKPTFGLRALIFAVLFSFSLLSEAKDLVLQSGPEKTAMIELYSSEGCSSCPPAEAWLVSLRRDKNLWKTFVPMEFHVDYWNRLGWVDPFSNKQFTKRQHRYASEWQSSRVYTPGFAKNGEEWRGKKTTPLKKGNQKVGVLKVQGLSDRQFKVEFSPQGSPKGSYKVHGALLGNGLSTKVPRGENAGEVLKHEFVVLTQAEGVMTKKNSKFLAALKLPKSVKAKAGSYSVAFWVTSGGSQKPIQVVGGDL